MSAHALKKVPPKRISFVAAVTKYQDDWRYGVALVDVGAEALRTFDTREATSMKCMERGTMARFYESPFDEDLYPPINVYAVGNCGWIATREGYDGAPDSHDPLGSDSWSKFAAIADLIERELESA